MPAVSMIVAPLKKQAEDMPDSTYESSLSTLARNVLQDKSPRLFDYEIGFQLMEKSDDGDKAVGVFGFQVGPETLYAPVVFNNGAVKGTELLWAKSLGQFIPLAEGWVNAYMRRRPTAAGQPIDKAKSRDGVGYPDLMPLIRSPFKMAGPVPRLTKTEARSALAEMRKAAGRAFEILEACDLNKLAAKNPKFAGTIRHWLAESPTYKRAFTQFYPNSPLAQPAPSPQPPILTPSPVMRPGPMAAAPAPIGNSLAQTMAPTIGRTMTAGATPKSTAPSPVLTGGMGGSSGQTKDNNATALAKTADYGTVAVTTDVQSVGELIPLSVGERADVATNRYAVNDSRTMSSMVIPVSHNLHLSNPKGSGRYKVLQPDGEFADRLVVFLRDRKADRRAIVLDVSDSGKVTAYGRCEPNEVWVNPRDGDEDTPTEQYRTLNSALSNFPEPKSVTPNWRSKYLLIGPDGVGVGPFTVRQDLTQDDGPTTLAVNESHCGDISPVSCGPGGHNDMLWFEDKANPYWGYGTRYERIPSSRSSYHYDQTLIFTGKPGHTVLRDRGDLLVPSGSRMITLEEGGSDENIEKADEDKDTITLGRPEDLNDLIGRKSAELVVDLKYGRYSVGKKAALQFPEAVKELIVGWDRRETDALDLLKQADRHRVTARVVPTDRVWALAEEIAKRADGPPDSFNVGSGASAPDFPEMPTDYTEQTLSGSVPANTPYDVKLPVDPSMLSANRTTSDMYAPPENSTIMQAADAASKGVKEVFDTGSFSTLMRRHGDDVLIDDNLPDLMKSLGAIGTLLFNLYYSSEEFEDRYGKNDLQELEGVLRSAFKSVGESLLYLKQKSVRAFPGDYGVDFSSSTPNN